MATAAPKHGKGGSITFTTITLGVLEWTLDYTMNPADSTTFTEAGVKTFILGTSEWKGTVKTNYDPANTAVVTQAAASLVLTVAASNTYTGSVLITNMAVSVNKDNIATVDYSFQGTGALVIAQA
jgi:hypothetical protein